MDGPEHVWESLCSSDDMSGMVNCSWLTRSSCRLLSGSLQWEVLSSFRGQFQTQKKVRRQLRCHISELHRAVPMKNIIRVVCCSQGCTEPSRVTNLQSTLKANPVSIRGADSQVLSTFEPLPSCWFPSVRVWFERAPRPGPEALGPGEIGELGVAAAGPHSGTGFPRLELRIRLPESERHRWPSAAPLDTLLQGPGADMFPPDARIGKLPTDATIRTWTL